MADNLTEDQRREIRQALKIQVQNDAKIIRLLHKSLNKVEAGLIRTFAQTAAKYTPPNIGRSYIDPKYYKRPILGLIKLAKGGYPKSRLTQEDKLMIKQGYRFKVLNTKYKAHKKDQAFAYTKGINEAKRLSRIQNRGLSRYVWGNAINNLKEDTEQIKRDGGIILKTNLPPIFQRLARKSPNITKYQFGSVIVRDIMTGIQIKFINRLAQIQRYGQIAIRQGAVAVNRWWNRLTKAQLSNQEQVVNKILDKIDVKEVNINNIK